MTEPAPPPSYLDEPAEPEAPTPAADGRVRFVSRSAPAGTDLAPPLLDADGRPLPGLGDRALQLLLLFVLALLAYSWWVLEGYQIADSVEYMERAQSFLRGEDVLDSTSNRSFGFSTLLLPFFAVANWLGVENWQPIVSLSRSLQIVLALLLVRICVRLGARLGGRRVGLVAGFLVGVNPIFLQYGVSPVSGIAASLCVGHGLECLLERGDLRRGIRGGLWLGAAMMMAYQTILISAPLLVLVFVRDRWRRGGLLAGATIGLTAGALSQIGLDRLTYGRFGASFFSYLADNFLFQASYFLARIPGMHGLASKVYEATLELRGGNSTFDGVNVQEAQRLMPPDWYLTHLFEMLVIPVALLGALGLMRCLKRASWKSTLLLLVFVANVAVMSNKGSKDFRLWIPLLPMLMPLCAWGAGLVLGPTERRPGLGRSLVTAGLLGATLFLSLDVLRARNTRKFSGYWEAMDIVSERAGRARAQDPTGAKAVVSSAYDWAVFLRASEDIEMRKLPHHLDEWADLTEIARRDILETLGGLDWFLTHLPVLSDHPDLMAVVNQTFQIEAMLWENETFEETGPIFVLRKKTGEPGARTFFEVIEGVAPDAYRRAGRLPPALDFVRRLPVLDEDDYVERVTLLGWDYEELPGDGHGWITLHWYCGSQIVGDYTIVPRLTTYDERDSWQDDHAPAYGVVRTPRWKPGTIIRESRPVVAAAEPYNWQAPFRPMGGPYRRGDLMPAILWVDIATFGADGTVTGRMEPALPGADWPIRTGELVGARTVDGFAFSLDDLVKVGSFFLPVHERARVADDGRPIPK